MKVAIDTDVADKLGFRTAAVVELIYDITPNYDKAKIDVKGLAIFLSVNVRTVQRVIKSLVDNEYLDKKGRSEYSFTPLFFETFKSYKVYNVKII